MLRVYKIILDNKITINEISLFLNIFFSQVSNMLRMKMDLPLTYLIKIRDYLILKEIIDDSCDLGSLVDIV